MLNLTSCKPDFIASIEYFRVNLNLFFCWFVVIPCFPVPGKWSQARKPNTLWGMLGLLYKQKDRCVYCDCITLITTTTAVRKLLLSVFITAVDSAVVEERNNGWLSLSWLACLPEMKAHRARLINTQLELVHLSLYMVSTQQNDFKRRDRKDWEDNDVLFYRFSLSLLVLLVGDEDDRRK